MVWDSAPLGHVCPAKPSNNREISNNDVVWHLNLDQIESNTGEVLTKSYAPASEAGTSTSWFDSRHVLYSKLRPYLNKVVLADESGVATTELVPLLPDETRLDKRYLWHYLRSKQFVNWVSDQVAGAKMPRVRMKAFWDHEIPLPPIDEQKRIVELLDRTDRICRKRQQTVQFVDDFLRANFLEMFGDPVSNSKKLDEVRIDSFCEIVRGSSPRPKGDPRYYGGPVPRLMVQDLTRDGWFVTPKIDSLTLQGAQKSRPINAGTVVMAVSGNVGLTSILTVDACIHDGFVAFKNLDLDKILPEFLLFMMTFLKSTHSAREAGAIFKNLTTSQIKEMAIPVPSIPDQMKFVSIFKRQMEAGHSLSHSLTGILELKDSICANVFYNKR